MKVKFTTKSMIIDGNRQRVKYELDGEAVIVRGMTPDNKEFSIRLDASSEHYQAARAAYDEKAAKRAALEAAPREVPEKFFAGLQLKGRDFVIVFDASIDRATVTFKRKPSPKVREMVKAAGFWWTPTHGCWSRKLTHKAWRAGQELYQKLSA